MVFFLIGITLLALSLSMSITVWCYYHIKHYWIIGYKGVTLGILGPFNRKQYPIELNKVHDNKPFDDYVVWSKKGRTRDQIRGELMTMYHLSRPFRMIIENLHKGS